MLPISLTHLEGETYQITVTSQGWNVRLQRTYTEFYQLHQSLVDAGLKPPSCPQRKKSFLSFLLNHSIQLHQYLSVVLERFVNSAHVADFMRVNKSCDVVYVMSSIGHQKVPQFALDELWWFDKENSESVARLQELRISLSQTSAKQSRRSLEDFELLKVLGKGCMGKVLLAKERSSQRIFAIKSISKQWVLQHGRTEVQHTKDEQNILASVSHPFLIHLHCSFQTPENLFLVLEYVSGGDLATQLAHYGKFTVQRARFYAAEIVEGVKELHRLGIIYRDMKPENVLLHKSGHIRLTDFGLSKQFKLGHKIHQNCKCPTSDHSQHLRTKTFCGTAEYLAPEILLEQNYSFGVDWWSLGTFLFEMVFGMTPFWSENQALMYSRILNDVLEFPADVHDPDLIDFIAKLLVRDPSRRLGAGQQGGAKLQKHPFFSKHINWEDLYHLKIQPPYVPQLQDKLDVRWFDDMFTSMTPKISPHPMSPLHITANNDASHLLGSEEPFDSKATQAVDTKQCNIIPAAVFDGYTFVSSSISSRIARYNTTRKLSPQYAGGGSYGDFNEQCKKRRRHQLSSAGLLEEPATPPQKQPSYKSPTGSCYLGSVADAEMEFQMEF